MKQNTSYTQELSVQTTLWKRLKKWLQYAMILSSFLIAGLYAFVQSREPNMIFMVIIMVVLVLDCIWMLLIGRALKHGRENIEKLTQLCQK